MRYKNADWHVQPIHKLIVDMEGSRPDIWWTFEPYNVPAATSLDPLIGQEPTPGGHVTPRRIEQSINVGEGIPYVP